MRARSGPSNGLAPVKPVHVVGLAQVGIGVAQTLPAGCPTAGPQGLTFSVERA